MEQDLWLVMKPNFLQKFPNITKQLKRLRLKQLKRLHLARLH
jgi:hypothetical protein